MSIKENEKKEQAFKELFVENYSRLFYASLFIVGNEADAHDIVDEYFADLWENYSADDIVSVAYLYNGVKRKSLDYLRHLGVKSKYAKLYLALHKDGEPIFEEEEDRMAIIEQIIEKMPARIRFVLDQCYFENKKYEEVAEILGLSRDGVRKNIMKGLAILREAFNVKYKKGQATPVANGRKV